MINEFEDYDSLALKTIFFFKKKKKKETLLFDHEKEWSFVLRLAWPFDIQVLPSVGLFISCLVG